MSNDDMPSVMNRDLVYKNTKHYTGQVREGEGKASQKAATTKKQNGALQSPLS
jgi:hypothetical protein